MKFTITNAGIEGIEFGTKITAYPTNLQYTVQPENIAYSSEFGYRVLIKDNVMVVSDPSYNHSASSAGTVYIYRRSGASWTLESQVTAWQDQVDARFGESVALDNDTLIVGAPGYNSNGAIFSFERQQNQWISVSMLEPDDLLAGDFFGSWISIYQDTVAVACKNQNSRGSVYVYRYHNSIWTEVDKLLGTEDNQDFGNSIDIDDENLVIGSPGYQSTGAIYYYKKQNNTWQQAQMIKPESLVPAGAFGLDVSMDKNLLAAATLSGQVYIFIYRGQQWQQQEIISGSANFRKSVSLNSNLAAIGDFSDSSAGRVRFYSLEDNSWTQVGEISAQEPLEGDYFGSSVCVYQSLMAIGAHGQAPAGWAGIYAPVVPEPPLPPPPVDLSPVLLEAIPNTGFVTGGQQIILLGNNLSEVESVTFNGNLATDIYSYNNKSVSVTTPAGTAGAALVTVTTPYGSDSQDVVFSYIIPPPVVDSVTPNSGSVNGGATVTIIGNFLQDLISVRFSSTPATVLTVISDTEITVVSPAVPAAGTVDITVETVHGSVTVPASFVYFVADPVITALSPTTGTVDGGTLITITGLNLSTTQTITVGSFPATGTFIASDTLVTALTPEQSNAVTVPVVVTTEYGVSNNDFEFSYFSPPPTVASITPDTGTIDGGTPVSITGSYFVDVVDVTVGGISISDAVIVNKNLITGVTPSGAAGTASVSVTTAHGMTAPNSLFTYFVPAPDVFVVTPDSGSYKGGTEITISGNNLSTAQSVTVAGVAATDLTVIDDETITVITPAGTLGSASVIVTTDYGSNNANTLFEYIIPEPEVDSITPNSGFYAGGETVIIAGNYFTGTTAVMFGEVSAVSFVIIDDVTLEVVTPVSDVGIVTVTVTTDRGTSTQPVTFDYTAPPPEIDSIDPVLVSTSGGTEFVLLGDHFVELSSVNIGGQPATGVVATNYQTITGVAPAGTPGPADVQVITAYGSTTATGILEYFTPATDNWFLSLSAPTSVNFTAWDIEVDNQGNSFISASYSPGSSPSAPFISKISPEGNVLFQQQLTGTDNNSFRELARAASGNIYASGTFRSTSTNNDFMVAKMDSSGSLAWQRRFDTSSTFDFVQGIDLDQDENVYLVGRVSLQGTAISIKLNSANTVIYGKRAVPPSGQILANTDVRFVSDGAAWTLQTSGTTNNLQGTVWTGSQFVAVGDLGTILTSADGITWTPRTSGTTQNLQGVALLGSVIAAVGWSGSIRTSTDGITWTSRTSGTSNSLQAVASSSSLFVTVGNSGTILTSADGITWTPRTSGTTNALQGVAWAGSQWIAVGNSGTILASTDGITWTPRTSSTTQNLQAVAASGSLLVAVGNSGTILTSASGSTWIPRTSSTTQNMFGVVWTGSQWVAVGNSGTVLTSTDGITWTAQTSGTTNPQNGVASSGSQLSIVGGLGTILTRPISGTLICGWLNSDSFNREQPYAARLDPVGLPVWQRILDFPADKDCIFTAMCLDSNQDPVMVGGTGINNDLTPAIVVKAGAVNGNLILGKYLGADGDRAEAVARDDLGNIYIAGLRPPVFENIDEFTTIKVSDGKCIIYALTSSLDLIWSRTLSLAGRDLAGYGITVDATDVYVSGTISNPAEPFVAKLPRDGSLAGTYGSLVYAAGDTTVSDINLNFIATAMTYQDQGLTTGNTDLTVTTTSFGQTKIGIP